jgi:hypothetical protein
MLTAILFLALQGEVVMRVAVTVPVDPPEALTAQAEMSKRWLVKKDCSVSLKWKGSPDLKDPAAKNTGYRIYRAIPGGKFAALNKNLIPDLDYKDSTVKQGTTYEYRVTALIGKVESKPSNTVSVKP